MAEHKVRLSFTADDLRVLRALLRVGMDDLAVRRATEQLDADMAGRVDAYLTSLNRDFATAMRLRGRIEDAEEYAAFANEDGWTNEDNRVN